MASASAEHPGLGLSCCLKACLLKPYTQIVGGGRVEVKALEPKGQKNMLVSWQDGGEAVFHRGCWATLVRAADAVTPSGGSGFCDFERRMVLEAKKTAESHDSDEKVLSEAVRIADILKSTSYCIGFTGAGISTSAGIGDYRGKDGKWTNKEKVKSFGAQAAKSKGRGYVLEQLRPTYTHEALVKLTEMGLLKFLISQNTDGLHKLSGIPAEKISELHGNAFIERCEKCDARYERTSACRRYRSGRRCTREGCNSYLVNTIINFGDYLEKDILSAAEDHALKADSVLVLGSTLQVSPANTLIDMGRETNRIIICNRQTTLYDDICDNRGPDGTRLGSRVFGDCDRLMREVMKCVLSPSQLTKWETGRATRLVEYGLKRTSVSR